MSEFEPGEEPIELKLERARDLIREQLGLQTEAEWAEMLEEHREEALCEVTDPDGTPVDPADLTPEQEEEALLRYYYSLYVVETTGEDPLGLLE